MTSQIVSATIDENFPVAGQDNDSQGFRDNFSIIKTGLATATSEVTDLQTNAAKLNVANNFNGTLIDNAQTNRLFGTVYKTDSVGTTLIDYENGEYQIVDVTGNHFLKFQGFPDGTGSTGKYAKVRVELKPSPSVPSIGWNVTFISTGGGTVVGTIGFALEGENPVINTGNDPTLSTVLEAWTSDGINFFIGLVGAFNATLGLESLTDVALTSPATNQVLKYDGTKWVNGSISVGSINSLENVGDVTGYTVGSLTTGDILKWNGTKWAFANDPTIASLNDIPDVDTTGAASGEALKFNGTNWIADSLVLNELGDVVIGGDPTNTLNTNHVLKYNGTSWINTKLGLDELKNTSITTPAEGDVIRFDSSSETWVNEKDPNLVVYTTGITDVGGGNDKFIINGTNIASGALTFYVNNIYRFDISGSSNKDGGGLPRAPLRFSTTSDLGTVTAYTSNVRIYGTPGTPGSFIEIQVTKDTPDVLYLYGDASGTMSNKTGLGGGFPIPVVKKSFYTGTEELVDAAAASTVLSTSYFSTAAAETATLANGIEGQIKTFAMYEDLGDMVITVANAGWKASGSGTITFDATGQACTLQFIASKWFCVGNNGATFA